MVKCVTHRPRSLDCGPQPPPSFPSFPFVKNSPSDKLVPSSGTLPDTVPDTVLLAKTQINIVNVTDDTVLLPMGGIPNRNRNRNLAPWMLRLSLCLPLCLGPPHRSRPISTKKTPFLRCARGPIHSEFGLRTSFGIRNSVFGFPPSRTQLT